MESSRGVRVRNDKSVFIHQGQLVPNVRFGVGRLVVFPNGKDGAIRGIVFEDVVMIFVQSQAGESLAGRTDDLKGRTVPLKGKAMGNLSVEGLSAPD